MTSQAPGPATREEKLDLPDGGSLAWAEWGDRAGRAVVFLHGTPGSRLFFPDPAQGLHEFRRVLRPHRRAAVCVIAAPERAPMLGVLPDILSQYLPDQREVLHLMFALADAERLARLFALAGFREISVTRETR